MSVYETLRHFADSYCLAAMMLVFVVLCAWPFLPGPRARADEAANSIFEGQDDGE